ncbi:MAG: hypothetical protein ACRDKL_04810, partial [Solirubrobacteraceae bacterium]
IHSSAGLTVLEALIRGCPVVSYGFGYGHVRVSNRALERFDLAQVAHTPEELRPALERALARRPEPDRAFAARPSTASMIVSNPRRAVRMPPWRVRTVRAAAAVAASVAVAVPVFTSSLAFNIVSAFAGTGATTKVPTVQKQVAIMVDTSARQVPALAHDLAERGIHDVSFAVSSYSPAAALVANDYGDDELPRLNDGGLVGWLHTKGQLHHMLRELGWGRRFLYTSSGPNLVQVLLADGAGGKLVGGAIKINHSSHIPTKLGVGEVIEIRPESVHALLAQLHVLREQLRDQHLHGVPVKTLFQGSGVQV